MVWCSYCAKDQHTERDDINGFTCCTGCGRVLDDNVYGSDPTFTKTAGGQSQVEGNFIKDGQSSFGRLGAGAGRILGYQSDSHEKTLAKGKSEIVEILERLSIRPRDDTATQAHRIYTIALERNFTRGRRTQQVAAACIYIVCRQNNKPYMLIDFSDCLQTNVYVLGAVFLQLCNLLRLEEQPFMQKPVDPSLFIHRFADRLQFGKKMHAVSNTALRLVASMKRDWMQTGRRPSGICGAALFISAHMHGFERSKGDVVSVVHICEATLKKRLVEFECTESGSLTAEEFELKSQEIESQIKAAIHSASIKGSKSITEIMCEHKDTGATHFSHGLCRSCYEEFWRVSGGMQGGSAPPSFQKAELQRMESVREQLKGQGLDSEDEDADGIPIKKIKGSSKGISQSEKSVDSLPLVEAHLTSRGRARGRGRGRGRSTNQNSTGDAYDGTHPTEQIDTIGKGRGRGRGRGRGKNEVIVNGNQSGRAANGDSHEESGEEMDDGRIRGKGRGMDRAHKAATDSTVGDIAGDDVDAPNDNDVLLPGGVPSKHTVRDGSKLGNPTETQVSNSQVNEPDVIDLESQIGTARESDQTASGTGVMDFQVDNPDMVAPSLDTGKGLAESLQGATSGSPATGPQPVAPLLDTGTEPSESLSTATSGSPATGTQPVAPLPDTGTGPESFSAATSGTPTIETALNDSEVKLGNEDTVGCLLDETSETLSDIDDDELTGYMNNDEEVRLKTILWTEMNKEYIQEQEAKEAALTAMEEARAAAIAAAASNSASAAELAAAAAAAVAKMKKDRKQKRVDDAKRPPAKSAAEATRQMLESKKLSTKVDYTVLAKLFDTDNADQENTETKKWQDEDADSEAPNRSDKRTRFSSQADGSQADSVITQISARRSIIREVDSKEGSVDVVDMNGEDEGELNEEEEGIAEDGEVEVGQYEYDEADDYYDEEY